VVQTRSDTARIGPAAPRVEPTLESAPGLQLNALRCRPEPTRRRAARVEIIDGDDQVVAHADLDRTGEYTPVTLVELDGSTLRRSEVWPAEQHPGLPVLLSGGEVGILQAWQHAEDRSWWQSVEFSNHTRRPDDWVPPGQHLRRGP
jgi:hypothetical protein